MGSSLTAAPIPGPPGLPGASILAAVVRTEDAAAAVDRLHLGRPTEVASAGIAWAWIELPDAAAPADIAAAQAILDGHPPT